VYQTLVRAKIVAIANIIRLNIKKTPAIMYGAISLSGSPFISLNKSLKKFLSELLK
jgi:hypothetical protein